VNDSEDVADVEIRGSKMGIGTEGTIGNEGNECETPADDDSTVFDISRGMYSRP
jgi:hypothetical protein